MKPASIPGGQRLGVICFEGCACLHCGNLYAYGIACILLVVSALVSVVQAVALISHFVPYMETMETLRFPVPGSYYYLLLLSPPYKLP